MNTEQKLDSLRHDMEVIAGRQIALQAVVLQMLQTRQSGSAEQIRTIRELHARLEADGIASTLTDVQLEAFQVVLQAASTSASFSANE